ncbi:MAG TPA: response regulator [Terracidiphilus sp.]|jgi:two-component system chemotaxis response regulator CheY
MRALIVDDSGFTRRVLRGLLEAEGFECSEAANALGGLDILRRGESFDVVLVDWNMPGMSGVEMVKELRRRGFDQVRIMMVTSLCDADGILQALEAGADEYLMKPFDGDALRQKLALMGLEAA